jgi:nitrogenase-stabilizing/protective protein
MRNEEMELELDDLTSAEDFLDFFEIDYDPRTVMVNRLHILQRFHDYLEKDGKGPQDGESWWAYYTRQLTQAYADFTSSDALTEKVFKVFHEQAKPQKPAFVPVEDLLK